MWTVVLSFHTSCLAFFLHVLSESLFLAFDLEEQKKQRQKRKEFEKISHYNKGFIIFLFNFDFYGNASDDVYLFSFRPQWFIFRLFSFWSWEINWHLYMEPKIYLYAGPVLDFKYKSQLSTHSLFMANGQWVVSQLSSLWTDAMDLGMHLFECWSYWSTNLINFLDKHLRCCSTWTLWPLEDHTHACAIIWTGQRMDLAQRFNRR